MTWSRIAQIIANRPWLINLLITWAQRSPYYHIVDSDETTYMRRWWLMPRWMLTPDERGNLMPRAWMPFSIRIHHIMRPDHDRHLHDHPFNYRTIILRGWYEEEDIFGKLHLRLPGDTVKATANTFHRINKVGKAGVWTLFIMGRRRNGWGFLVDGHKVDYRTYLGL